MATDPLIYKISPREDWEQARSAGIFTGAPIDLADGYIHFSTRAQVAETAAKHFTAKKDLILAAIDTTTLGDALKFEVSRNNDQFPHLYAELSMDSVVWSRPILLDENNIHILPFDGEPA